MYLKPVTSVADLLFKAKTEDAYRRLLIRGVQEFIWSGRNAQTVEEATAALDRYVSSPFVSDCSNLIKDINRCCNDIQREIQKERDLKVVVVKNREGTPNLNGDVYSTNPTTMAEPSANHYTLTRYAQHPFNGETLTFTRVIPLDYTPEQREYAERELENTVRHRLDQIRQQEERIHDVYRQSRNLWTTWYENGGSSL